MPSYTREVVEIRDVAVRAAPFSQGRFTHLLVFDNLVDTLAKAGFRITSAPRENGSGTPVALRVAIRDADRLPRPLAVPVLEAIFDPRGDSRYTHRLVLRGVSDAIAQAGARVELMESGDHAFEELEVRVKYRRVGPRRERPT